MLFRVMAVGCGTVDSRLHWTGATRLLDLCVIWRFLPSTDNVEMLLLCFHYVILDETARRTTGSAEELKTLPLRGLDRPCLGSSGWKNRKSDDDDDERNRWGRQLDRLPKH